MAYFDNAAGGYYLQRTFYANISKEPNGGAVPWICSTSSNVQATARLSFFNASVPVGDIDPLDSMSYSSPPEDWARTNQDVTFVDAGSTMSVGAGYGCLCSTFSPLLGQSMETHQQAGGVVSGDYYAHYWGDGLDAGEQIAPDDWWDLDAAYDLFAPAIAKVYVGPINNSATIGLVYYEDNLGTIGPASSLNVETPRQFVRIFQPGAFTLRAIGSRPYEYGIFLVPLTEADDQNLDKYLNPSQMYVSVSDDLSSKSTIAYSIPPAPDGYFYVITVEAGDLDRGKERVKYNYSTSPPVCTYAEDGHLTEVPTKWSIESCKDISCGSKPIKIPSPVTSASATLGHSSHITTMATLALICARFFL